MPIEPPNKQLFEVASGYAELGMFHEANEQLETIDPFLRAAPEVLALRIEIYRGRQIRGEAPNYGFTRLVQLQLAFERKAMLCFGGWLHVTNVSLMMTTSRHLSSKD